MRLHFIAGILVLGGATPHASAQDLDLLAVLPELLAIEGTEEPVFSARRVGDDWSVEYCPDNTCDFFLAPKDVPREVVGDFALLWLYYVSAYIYLERFYETDARPFVADTMGRHGTDCPARPEFERASCVLTSMATDYKIRLGFRRYDEGVVAESQWDVTDELSAANIARVKGWQLEQWR